MGSALLYLDTARLGLMGSGARRAHLDFARLAGSEGASPFFESFLRLGAAGWPPEWTSRYPGLAGWRGLPGLKGTLRSLADSDPELPVLVAGRSAVLMKFAARLLCHRCHNVLVTDLGWPAYQDTLECACRRRNRRVTAVPLRDELLGGELTEDESVNRVRQAFLKNRCDGLFLCAVSNFGVRLPVERIAQVIRAAAPVRFAVVDGAQVFCHTPVDLAGGHCDLYLTGCHKWLGAYHPLGLAFYGRRDSHPFINAAVVRLGMLDDPLLRFSYELEAVKAGVLEGTTETVNLGPLFSCQGAAADALGKLRPAYSSLPYRLRNADIAADLARASGWRPLLPPAGLRTGILLLQAERQARRRGQADVVRSAFYTLGVALTAYEGGWIRLSMPGRPWRPGESEHLSAVMRAVA